MRLNFSTGLLAGVLVASVLVFATGYSSSGPGLSTPATFRLAQTTATTTVSSSTTQAATSSSLQATLSNLSASAGVGNATGSQTTTVSQYVFAPAVSTGQSPSSLASIINQPGRLPLLLLPLLLALLLGFALYKASVEKD